MCATAGLNRCNQCILIHKNTFSRACFLLAVLNHLLMEAFSAVDIVPPHQGKHLASLSFLRHVKSVQ